LALVQQVVHNLRRFYALCALADNELAQRSPLIHGVLLVFNAWTQYLTAALDVDGHAPVGFFPHSHIDSGEWAACV
jgi:hypothetical protein